MGEHADRAPHSFRALSLCWKTFLPLAIAVVLLILAECVLVLCGIEPILLEKDPYVGFAAFVPLFVEEIDADGRTVIVTHGVVGVRVSKAGHILRKSLFMEVIV